MKWTIGQRVGAGYAVVLLLLTALAALAVFSLFTTAARFQRALEEQDRAVRGARIADKTLSVAQIGFLRYLLTGDPRYAELWRAQASEGEQALRALEEAGATAALRIGWRDAHTLHQRWRETTAAAVAVRASGQQDAAMRVRENRVMPALNLLTEANDRLVADQREYARSRTQAVASAAFGAVWVALLLALIAIVGGSVIAVWLTRSITGALRETVSVLTTSSVQILAATTEQASGIAEEASAVQETTTTVDELRQTSELATEKAQAVADAATKMVETAGQGRQSVEETLASMAESRSRLQAIAERILALSERGQAIGEIIATVDDVAEQSNILAVNAAIEAAKAGEAGRGFAVVAAEVKGLAEQSKQGTAQVRTILGEIQRATQGAVLAMEQGVKAGGEAERVAARAGEAIRLLAQSQQEAAQSARQILVTTRQQLVGVDQIASAMQHIQQSSTQNRIATEQVTQAAHDLHEVAARLTALVSG